VYAKLGPLKYTVVGGRETTVGVGGLTLGGGISYYSGRYGLACDNVLSYETVLAYGTVANISQSNAPDLYRALPGGGNNFAVVTRYHLAAFACNLMQGGLTLWSDSPATQASQIAAFTHVEQQRPARSGRRNVPLSRLLIWRRHLGRPAILHIPIPTRPRSWRL
jgi:FAD binding domain